MGYLEFNKRDEKHIGIWNKNKEYLGALELVRVGAWMSWCLTDVPSPNIYFSGSCIDEITAKRKELNAHRFKRLKVR